MWISLPLVICWKLNRETYPIVKYRPGHRDILKTWKMFYFNTIEQLFLFVEQLDQLEVWLPYSRLLTGIIILAVFKNLRWNSNKTSLRFYLLLLKIQALIFSWFLSILMCWSDVEKLKYCVEFLFKKIYCQISTKHHETDFSSTFFILFWINIIWILQL